MRACLSRFKERIRALSIQTVENETWDSIGHADLALAASGTVTVEAALLGTPLVTFYKVAPLSWWAGRRLVKVPFLSMVNLIAERRIVPELIQQDMTASTIAAAAEELLTDPEGADRMRADLAQVRLALTSEGGDKVRLAGELIRIDWEGEQAHALLLKPLADREAVEEELIAAKRQAPGDDLLSAFVAAEEAMQQALCRTTLASLVQNLVHEPA